MGEFEDIIEALAKKKLKSVVTELSEEFKGQVDLTFYENSNEFEIGHIYSKEYYVNFVKTLIRKLARREAEIWFWKTFDKKKD